MTIYADQPGHQWTIEAPFAEQGADARFYDEGGLPFIDAPYGGYQDVMRRQRVILALALAMIALLLLGALALPRAGTAAQGGATAVTQVTALADTAVNPSPSGIIAPLFTPEVQYWAPKIGEWARLYGVDPNIVATIMQIESCGNPAAVSSAGAQGLFQVMPFHFAPGEDMRDPDTNARRGMNFFNAQMDYTGGDVLLSFAGYNGGYAASGGAYATWPDETKRYYRWAKGIYADAAAGRSSSETLAQWLAAGGAAGCQTAAAQLGLK